MKTESPYNKIDYTEIQSSSKALSTLRSEPGNLRLREIAKWNEAEEGRKGEIASGMCTVT
jgi:hypothetical protein